MIELENVRKSFPGKHDGGPICALAGIDLRIDAGELVTIVGPSGSGKSTLLFTIGAMMKPTAGQVKVAGSRIYDLPAAGRAELRRRFFGFVFQTFNLLPYLTCRENVALPALLGAVPRPEALERAQSMLRRLGLGNRLSHRPAELSIGERQRVALARSLINAPAVLLADEPTGNLDPYLTDQVMELLQELNGDGQTIILVTHNLRLAERGTRVIELGEGRLVGDRPSATASALCGGGARIESTLQ